MSGFERLLLDNAEQMMLLVEPAELRIVAANRVASLALGYSDEELLARSIGEIESSLQDVFYWEDVRNGQYQNIDAHEGLYLRADATTLAVRKSVRVLEHDGRSLLLVQARDIKNEHRLEDDLAQTLSQLRATLESTGNGILVIDWQGRIANINREFSRMWNIPDALLLGHDDAAILDFIVAGVADAEACRVRLREIVDSKVTRDTLVLRDGRIFECKSRPQYLGERIVGRVFGYEDITERQMAEQALRESRDQLEEKVQERTADLRAANADLRAERARQEDLIGQLAEAHSQLLQSEKMASIGQLAAGVAHEINNPVGFVNSNLSTLQRYVDDMLQVLSAYERSEAEMTETTRSTLAALKQQVDIAYLRDDIGNLLTESIEGLQRVKRIVLDLKSFSHADSSHKQLANLEQGLDSTLNVVWNELKYKADVVKEYGGIPTIECILPQLNQVFMNLLMNAVQAIEVHGQITVRTGQEGENVWVEVADTGSGIDPGHLERVFDPFFTTKPVGSGTGLGLSLSYGIVQQHGGRIEVKSQPGEGSTFRVWLPKHPIEPEASPITAEPSN
ncbi:MAG: ATP-binding protein [Sterolibacterium sp.]|jgi:PAS domain S-box-containing protein